VRNLRWLLTGLLWATLTAVGCRGGKGKVVLRVLTPPQFDFVASLAKEFESANPRLSIVVEKVEGAYSSELLSRLESASPPDIFIIWTDDVELSARLGKLRTLKPWLGRRGEPNPSDYYRCLVDAFTREGRLLALPFAVCPQMLMYNKALFDRAGIAYPKTGWTWDEVRAAARKLTRRDAKGKITQVGLDSNLDPLAWIYLGGGSLLDDQLHPTDFIADSPGGLRGLECFRGFICEDVDFGDTWSARKTDATFMRGSLAMVHTAGWMLKTVQQGATMFDWDVVGVPRFTGAEPRLWSYGWGVAMRADTAHPALAWKFLSYLAGVNGQRKLAAAGTDVPAMTAVAKEWSRYHAGRPRNKAALLEAANAAVFPSQWIHWYAAMNTVQSSINGSNLFDWRQIAAGRVGARDLSRRFSRGLTSARLVYFPASAERIWKESLREGADGLEDRAFDVLVSMFTFAYPNADIRRRADVFLRRFPQSRYASEVSDMVETLRIRDREVTEKYVNHWSIVGPFDFSPAKEIDRQRYAPELRPVDLKASYRGSAGKQVRWSRVPADVGVQVNLRKVLDYDLKVAYAVTYLRSGGTQDGFVTLSSDDGVEVWLNGRKVLSKDVYRAFNYSPDIARVSFRKGWNELLVKISQDGGDWALRAGTVTATPLQDSYVPAGSGPAGGTR